MGSSRRMDDIAAGPPGHLYVLGPPSQGNEKTIYKYNGGKKWGALPGKRASSVAVGPRGQLYITSKGKVYVSHDFVEESNHAQHCSIVQETIVNKLETERDAEKAAKFSCQTEAKKMLIKAKK